MKGGGTWEQRRRIERPQALSRPASPRRDRISQWWDWWGAPLLVVVGMAAVLCAALAWLG